MKQLLMLILLTLSQVTMAGLPEGKKAEAPATLEAARRYNMERKDVSDYIKAVESGEMTAKIKADVIKFLTDSAGKVGGVDAENLQILAAARPEILHKITQLVSLIQKGSAAQKAKATADLRILSEAGKFDTLDAASVEGLEKITEMPDYNESAKKFKAKLIEVLELNKVRTIAEAVEKASDGKITLDKIKDCII